VDVFSCGAIIAEAAGFAPLFAAGSEVEMLCRLFGALGTPDPAAWPDLRTYPHWHARFPQWPGRPMAQVVPCLAGDPLALHLLQHLLAVRPDTRVTAAQALYHPFFRPQGDLVSPLLAPAVAALQAQQHQLLQQLRQAELEAERAEAGGGRAAVAPEPLGHHQRWQKRQRPLTALELSLASEPPMQDQQSSRFDGTDACDGCELELGTASGCSALLACGSCSSSGDEDELLLSACGPESAKPAASAQACQLPTADMARPSDCDDAASAAEQGATSSASGWRPHAPTHTSQATVDPLAVARAAVISVEAEPTAASALHVIAAVARPVAARPPMSQTGPGCAVDIGSCCGRESWNATATATAAASATLGAGAGARPWASSSAAVIAQAGHGPSVASGYGLERPAAAVATVFAVAPARAGHGFWGGPNSGGSSGPAAPRQSEQQGSWPQPLAPRQLRENPLSAWADRPAQTAALVPWPQLQAPSHGAARPAGEASAVQRQGAPPVWPAALVALRPPVDAGAHAGPQLRPLPWHAAPAGEVSRSRDAAAATGRLGAFSAAAARVAALGL